MNIYITLCFACMRNSLILQCGLVSWTVLVWLPFVYCMRMLIYGNVQGFLFRAYPTLMTLNTSATIMDAIFASPEEEARGRLLKIMQDFLITEAVKQSAHEKGNIWSIPPTLCW